MKTARVTEVSAALPKAGSQTAPWAFAPTLLRGSSGTLVVIVLGALVLRLALLPYFIGISPGTFDEKQFNALAVNLLERGEFAFEAGRPTSMRPPLYAFVVVAVYRLAGPENYQAVRLVQVVFNVLTAIVLYYLARELFEKATATWATILCLAYPSLWGHSYLLLTEVVFTFLLCLALLFLVRFFRHDRMLDLVAGSVLLALAALTRSAIFLFPPAFMTLTLCARRLSWARRLAAAAIFLAAFCGTLAPWAIRNTSLQGTLTFVDTNGGRILRWSLKPVQQDKPAKAAGAARERAAATEGQLDRQAMRQSFGFMLQRPAHAAWHVVANFFRFWRLERELVAGMAAGNLGQVPPGALAVLACAICGFYVFLFLTALLGVCLFPPRDRLSGALLLLTVAHVCLVHSFVYGHSRYHIVVMPLVAIWSANFLVNIRSAFAPALRARLVTGGAVSCVFIGSWAVQLIQDDLAPLLRLFAGG